MVFPGKGRKMGGGHRTNITGNIWVKNEKSVPWSTIQKDLDGKNLYPCMKQVRNGAVRLIAPEPRPTHGGTLQASEACLFYCFPEGAHKCLVNKSIL